MPLFYSVNGQGERREGSERENTQEIEELNHIPALLILTTEDFCQSFKA